MDFNKISLFKTFPSFQNKPGLIQAFSTRKGGISQPPFDALNLGLHTKDLRAAVLKNRTLYFKTLGIPPNRLVFPEQVHSNKVVTVRKAGVVSRCDALITNTSNLFLTIQTADCFPVFLFEPIAQAVGIVHSGWRGTAKNIVGKAIALMESELKAKPGRMLAAIGPGVQQACYQVDDVTASHFSETFLLPDGANHFKLDVQGCILQQLRDAGIPNKQIERDTTCTLCATDIDMYYSYRRDGNKSGRMMGVIGLAGNI